jgi:putative transposase
LRVNRILARLDVVQRTVCADFDCDLVEFNGEANHAHLLVAFPRKAALSRLVNSLNGASSGRTSNSRTGLSEALLTSAPSPPS